MKNRMVWFVFLIWFVSAVSASCTHKPFHPTKSDREWNIDHEACQRWAREGIRDEPDTYDYNDEMRIIWNCMKDKGWQWERTDLFKSKKEQAE